MIILTIMWWTLLAGIIMGELHKVPNVLGSFPLLMSRSGRGAIVLFIGFETCCRSGAVLGLALPAMIIGLCNLFLGKNDSSVTIEMAYAEVNRESTVEMKGKTTTQQKQPQRNVDIEDFGNPVV
jgi:hypothetical protein